MSAMILFAVSPNLRVNGRKIEILADEDFDLRPGSAYITPLKILSGPQGSTYTISTPSHILHRRGYVTGVGEDTTGNIMIFFNTTDGNISIRAGDVVAIVTPVMALTPALVPAEGKLANGQTFAYDENGVMRFSEPANEPPPSGTVIGKPVPAKPAKRSKKKKS